MGLSSGFNLQPGVHESDLPGNRPEDVAIQQYRDEIGEEEMLDFIEAEEFDCPGCVLYRSDEHEDVWLLESEEPPALPNWPRLVAKHGDQEYAKLIVLDRDVGLSYVLAFHDDQVIDAMCERYLETYGESE